MAKPDEILRYDTEDIERIPLGQEPVAPEPPPGPETPGQAVADALKGFAERARHMVRPPSMPPAPVAPVVPGPTLGKPPGPGFPWKALLAGAAGAVVIGLAKYGIQATYHQLTGPAASKPKRRRRRGRRRKQRA